MQAGVNEYMNQKKGHVISRVLPGSIAEELEIAPGDRLLAIDNTEIEDIFDYQFLIQDNYIEVVVENRTGSSGCWRWIRSTTRIWELRLRTG